MGQKYTLNEKTGLYSTLVWDGTYKDGKKHRKQLTSKKSSLDLEKKVAAFKRKVEQQGSAGADGGTFGAYAQDWLLIHKATNELNTRKMYKSIINSHFNLIYDLPMSAIRHSHVQMMINELIEHPRTARITLITFRQIIRSAVRDRLLPRTALEDLLTDVSLPKCKKPEKRALSAMEKDALEKAELDERKRAFISVLYYCGLRRGEAIALRRSDFDWTAGTVSVRRVIVFDSNRPVLKDYPKSDRGIRTVPIPQKGIERIRPWVDRIEDPDAYVFTAVSSLDPNSVAMMTEQAYRRLWESIVCSMNIALGYDPQAKLHKTEKPIKDLTAHVFRHNYCTEMCYQIPRISTKMVAKLLGDNEKMVLDVYSHILEEREDTLGAVNAAFDF